MTFAKLPTAHKNEFVYVNPLHVAIVLPVNGNTAECHVCTLGTFSGSWGPSGGEIDSCIIVGLSPEECVAALEAAK